MNNRLSRDQILHRALDLTDSAGLNAKERPGDPPATLSPNAMSVGWLQDGLDLFHRAFPWSSTITKTAVTLSAETLSAPSDLTLDFRDGVIISQTSTRARLRRRSLNWLLSYDVATTDTGQPTGYVLIDHTFHLRPIPDTTYTGFLWYYRLPEVLAASDRPSFPDDWTLVEYVHLRGREWTGESEPTAAMTFALAAIGKLKAAGLGQEPENDALELDPVRWSPSGSGGFDRDAWMGSSVPR